MAAGRFSPVSSLYRCLWMVFSEDLGGVRFDLTITSGEGSQFCTAGVFISQPNNGFENQILNRAKAYSVEVFHLFCIKASVLDPHAWPGYLDVQDAVEWGPFLWG